MNIQFLFGIITVFGVLGIALFIAGVFNLLAQLPRRGKGALAGYGEGDKAADDYSDWPLSARIARSIFSRSRDQPPSKTLMIACAERDTRMIPPRTTMAANLYTRFCLAHLDWWPPLPWLCLALVCRQSLFS